MRALKTLFMAVCFCGWPVAAAQGWQTLGDVSSFERQGQGIEIQAQRGRVRILVLSPTVVRVRYTQNQFLDRQSFAVLPNAFQNDAPHLQIADSSHDISLSTGALTVRIYKSPLRIRAL